MEKINTITVNGTTYQIGGGSVGDVVETTYAELKSLKDSNSLVIGQQYKLIDYETLIVTPSDSTGRGPILKVAGHKFDLILTAAKSNSFNPIAKASKRADDNYFLNSNLDAWVIYYSFDNDSTNYPVDSTCKGYIYRMIDEYNNDVNYDFKNIKMAVSCQTVHNISEINSNDKSYQYSYFYLFSYANSTSVEDLNQAQDASILGHAKNNKFIFNTNLNNIIPSNRIGATLLAVKGLMPGVAIEKNEIISASCFIFSKGGIISSIKYNTILYSNFTTSNIAGDVSNNYILNNSDVCIGIQNWEADNYNHIMGAVRNNYIYPNVDFSCYGTSKNGVSFEKNVIFVGGASVILSDYKISNCKIEGEFHTGAVLDAAADYMYLLGNNTADIRKVAIYDIGL